MSELKPRITENGIDYILVGDYYIPDLKLPEEQYEKLSEQVEAALQKKLLSLIRQGKDVVIDFSFWNKENRNVYKELIQKAGAETELVYMKASKELALVSSKNSCVLFLCRERYRILAVSLQPLVKFILIKAVTLARLGGRNAAVAKFHVESCHRHFQVCRCFLHTHRYVRVRLVWLVL